MLVLPTWQSALVPRVPPVKAAATLALLEFYTPSSPPIRVLERSSIAQVCPLLHGAPTRNI